MRKISSRLLLIAAITPLATVVAQRQTTNVERPTAVGWEFVGLPALNYSSDEGFGYGVLAEIYNYGNGLTPYKYTLQPTIFLTTKGRRDGVFFFDAPHVLPNGWRFDFTLAHEEQQAMPYYGIGNTTVYDSTLERAPNPYYYRYERVGNRFATNVQHKLGNAPARFLVGYGIQKITTDATPYDSGSTLLASQLGGAPSPSGTIGFVRAGLVWDTRDREIGPNKGTWAELLAQRVDRMFGASDEYTRVTATVRHYIPIRANLVGAVRVLAQQTSGDVRFYDMPTLQSSFKNQEGLGGDKSVRGIAKTRYLGKGVMLMNSELRWRFKEFSVLRKPVFLLASGFFDAGRVWDESIKPGEIFTGLHTGFGGGLRVGLGPSFVVATDLGKSSESSQLYIGLGYLF